MAPDHASTAPEADARAAGEAARARRVAVLLPLPLDTAYTYLVPPHLDLAAGDVVRVPLGRRELVGLVWESDPADPPDLPADRLKRVSARLPVPRLPAVELRFLAWVAGYTLAPLGAVLRMALSVPAALEPPRPRRLLRLAGPLPPTLKPTPARRRVLAVAEDGFARPASELARAAGVGSGVVKGLVEAGVLAWESVPERTGFALPDAQRPGLALSPEQAAAAEALRARLGAGFSATLLDGVTGSGKTEVYFEAVAAALTAGRQALVLLPEIALSAQWLERFERRFGVRPAQWHSDLTAAERRRTWRAVAEGEARVVVGARSALFLPYPALGLIVVDEEHEAAYKQEEGVIYHARDMAVVRARLGEIPIVLASATPSLESVLNVEAGKYRRLDLPDRHGGAALPAVELVDLRRTPPPRLPSGGQGWLSPPLRDALATAFEAGEQALLFLNRRGFAPLTLCRACGHRLHCPNCTAWLVEHRFQRRLQCHHCGYAMPLPDACPDCGAEGALVACGPGIERVAEEAAALFPAARTLLVSSDTLPGPGAAAALVERIRAREVDLVIGTQIVAKGHHFPWLTCVGVVDADLGLAGGDLRAVERTYQLLHQVAGRAGRAQRAGRVWLQTYDPGHPVMRALAEGDRDAFLAREAEARRQGALPPFARLAALVLSAPDAETVEAAAQAVARAAPWREGVQILGPAPAPLAVLRGRHRRRFLVKARRDLPLQAILRDWLARPRLPNAVRLAVDIDPYSFL